MDNKEEQECCCLSSSGSGDDHESVSSAIESDDRPHLGTLSPAAGGYHATASAMFSTTSS